MLPPSDAKFDSRENRFYNLLHTFSFKIHRLIFLNIQQLTVRGNIHFYFKIKIKFCYKIK